MLACFEGVFNSFSVSEIAPYFLILHGRWIRYSTFVLFENLKKSLHLPAAKNNSHLYNIFSFSPKSWTMWSSGQITLHQFGMPSCQDRCPQFLCCGKFWKILCASRFATWRNTFPGVTLTRRRLFFGIGVPWQFVTCVASCCFVTYNFFFLADKDISSGTAHLDGVF